MSLYAKILVINLMHIGDLLLVTPVLRTLRTNYPQAHIALLADAKLADLVKYNQNINELIAIDKKGYHNKLGNYLRAVQDIRRQKFDLVINLHANERASFIAAFSGAKKIVGYSTFGLGWLFHRMMKNRKAVKHQVESHFDVLKEFVGIDRTDDRGIEMWLDAAAENAAAKIWQEAFGSQQLARIVGLNIGASWPTKRWRNEYYAELADRLLDMGYGIAYFGGPMDVELVEETIGLMRNKNHPLVKVFTGKVSLQVLAALLKKCAVLVTNDSGPMHVAVAMDVPLVTMFGSSPVPGFYPYNNISILIKTPVDCHPCGEHHCDTHECMKLISVDTVMKYTIELLEKYGDRQGALPRKMGDFYPRIIEL
ncbi:lipopolysaccharide heptosyltransferase II [Methylomusa anaerophila]